jgi:peptidoglycan/xylan/chitin deacetylase (PgdA/CDA1 family)
LLVAGFLAPVASAQSCPPSADSRAVELRAGDTVGGLTEGFDPAPLKDREVVLTFDDGPDPQATRRILDLLKQRCVVATFFPLGERAAENPALVQRIVSEGHTIGGHTWSHPDLTGMSVGEAADEILRGFQSVKPAGVPAQLFRFPQLLSSPRLLEWLERRGIATVSADIDPWDWAGDPPAQTLQRLKAQLSEKGRGIILLHDNQANTAKLLPDLLDFLAGEGYRVVPLRAAPPIRSGAG